MTHVDPPPDDEPLSVGQALRWIVLHPWQALGRRWNYKAAVLSSVSRASLFFAANVSVGFEAAVSAMMTELAFRFVTSGFYGAMTQAFRRVEPARAGTLAAMVLLPLVAHSLEFLVHWWRGTAALATSITASVAFTAVSTAFNLFAMRHGALVVGRGCRSLVADLSAMPGLLTLFVVEVARKCARAWA
jgi:hypothetical protein